MYLKDSPVSQKYVAISPASWYENGWITSLISKVKVNKNKKFFMSMGGLEPGEFMKGNAKKIENHFRGNPNFKYKVLEDKDHLTTFPSGITHWLLYVFDKKLIKLQ